MLNMVRNSQIAMLLTSKIFWAAVTPKRSGRLKGLLDAPRISPQRVRVFVAGKEYSSILRGGESFSRLSGY
jgi:hypothetical protein